MEIISSVKTTANLWIKKKLSHILKVLEQQGKLKVLLEAFVHSLRILKVVNQLKKIQFWTASTKGKTFPNILKFHFRSKYYFQYIYRCFTTILNLYNRTTKYHVFRHELHSFIYLRQHGKFAFCGWWEEKLFQSLLLSKSVSHIRLPTRQQQ